MNRKVIKVNDEINLRLAEEGDAELLHRMKYQSFLPLYKKYQDSDTSPAMETLSKVETQLKQEFTDYYVVEYKNQEAGGIRIRHNNEKVGVYHISPIFILPEYQNRGIARRVILTIFDSYPQVITWKLATILQEKGNCYLYEKIGFIRDGFEKRINSEMTLIGYEKANVSVREFLDEDAEAVASLIIRNFKEVNVKDYGEEAIEKLVETHDSKWVLQVASYAHMYVFCRENVIVACGSISSFWGSLTESILLTIFVLPEYHGKGVGRKIIHTLEKDELYIRANRIEIPASITACQFYLKYGYKFKNGDSKLDEEGHYRLEKYKEIG